MNMDLSSILPLLMSKNKSADASADKSSGAEAGSGGGNDTMATLLTAVASGKPLDKTEMLTKLMPASSNGSNIAQMISMANSMSNQKKQTSTLAHGLAPINNVASSDILGRLVKVMQSSFNSHSNNGKSSNNNNSNGESSNNNNNNGNFKR